MWLIQIVLIIIHPLFITRFSFSGRGGHWRPHPAITVQNKKEHTDSNQSIYSVCSSGCWWRIAMHSLTLLPLVSMETVHVPWQRPVRSYLCHDVFEPRVSSRAQRLLHTLTFHAKPGGSWEIVCVFKTTDNGRSPSLPALMWRWYNHSFWRLHYFCIMISFFVHGVRFSAN